MENKSRNPYECTSYKKGLYDSQYGPHHPSMHGVLRLILSLDGEDVIDCEPILGYYTEGWKKLRKTEQLYNICLMYTWEIFKYLKELAISEYYVGVESYSFSSLMACPFMADIGVAADLPHGWLDNVWISAIFLTGVLISKLITRNPIFLERALEGFQGGLMKFRTRSFDRERIENG
uniref:NADH-quinone oxidoreductase subunit D domain-containing protein n=1 Tax=Populus trichocarpa TaxID=3694 RepID=A0A2K1Y5I2_POPTR